MFDRRTRRGWGYLAVGIGGGLGIALLPLLLSPMEMRQPLSGYDLASLTIAQGLAAAWALVFAALGFRAFDEFAQRGSRTAWYWGSLAGTAASVPIYAFVALGGLRDGALFAHAFGLGYGLLLVMQLLGFTVAAIWWRVSRR